MRGEIPPVNTLFSSSTPLSLRLQEDQMDTPESTYQATFDTLPGVWSDVYLPWHNFVPVRRAQSDPEGEPLNPSKVRGRRHLLLRPSPAPYRSRIMAPGGRWAAGVKNVPGGGSIRLYHALPSPAVLLFTRVCGLSYSPPLRSPRSASSSLALSSTRCQTRRTGQS